MRQKNSTVENTLVDLIYPFGLSEWSSMSTALAL